MNYNEQTDALVMELDTLIRRFLDEFDINTYTVAGILEAKKFDVLLDTGVDFVADEELTDGLDEDEDDDDQTQL
jgi:hypothetical protein